MNYDPAPVLDANKIAELSTLWMNSDFWNRSRNNGFWRTKDGYFVTVFPKNDGYAWFISDTHKDQRYNSKEITDMSQAFSSSFKKFVELRNQVLT